MHQYCSSPQGCASRSWQSRDCYLLGDACPFCGGNLMSCLVLTDHSLESGLVIESVSALTGTPECSRSNGTTTTGLV